jgi:hypothetical protein
MKMAILFALMFSGSLCLATSGSDAEWWPRLLGSDIETQRLGFQEVLDLPGQERARLENRIRFLGGQHFLPSPSFDAHLKELVNSGQVEQVARNLATLVVEQGTAGMAANLLRAMSPYVGPAIPVLAEELKLRPEKGLHSFLWELAPGDPRYIAAIEEGYEGWQPENQEHAISLLHWMKIRGHSSAAVDAVLMKMADSKDHGVSQKARNYLGLKVYSNEQLRIELRRPELGSRREAMLEWARRLRSTGQDDGPLLNALAEAPALWKGAPSPPPFTDGEWEDLAAQNPSVAAFAIRAGPKVGLTPSRSLGLLHRIDACGLEPVLKSAIFEAVQALKMPEEDEKLAWMLVFGSERADVRKAFRLRLQKGPITVDAAPWISASFRACQDLSEDPFWQDILKIQSPVPASW